MVSTLFHNNLAAELAAEREKSKALQLELIKVTKQRDLIKLKWEQLDEEMNKIHSINKNLVNLNLNNA